MTTLENIDIEFKELDRGSQRIPPSVVKTLVAFLTTEGGDLFIGIQDNGNVCGVHDADDTSNRLSSLIHDAILPDASPFISLRIVTLEERRVVRVSVWWELNARTILLELVSSQVVSTPGSVMHVFL